MRKVSILLNGEPTQVDGGVSLLLALERAGAHVPHLCHDERLAPAGACRLCSVEIGASKPVPACTIEVREGMQVRTHTPELEAHRRTTAALELLVVQDLFMTATAREYATVFLPAASSFEKDGTFMNAERRVQRVRAALSAPGQARDDAQIVCALAAALGQRQGFEFRDAEEIWNEVRAVWPKGAGISYERLAQHGLQWPCPSEDHPGTSMLHTEAFSHGPRAALRRIEYRATSETTCDDYPLLLVTGRRLYQFNAGTMTERTLNHELQPEDVLDISAQDALAYGLQEHDVVLLRSRYGEVTVPVQIVDTVAPGQLFATFHTVKAFLNRVTSSQRDSITHTPEYKVTAVQVHKISAEHRAPSLQSLAWRSS